MWCLVVVIWGSVVVLCSVGRFGFAVCFQVVFDVVCFAVVYLRCRTFAFRVCLGWCACWFCSFGLDCVEVCWFVLGLLLCVVFGVAVSGIRLVFEFVVPSWVCVFGFGVLVWA